MISTFSRESMSGLNGTYPFGSQNVPNNSVAWPVANTAIFVPFVIWSNYLVQTVWWGNGSTANGNVDCGVFSHDAQSLLFNAGTTAQSGTQAIQTVALSSSVLLAPGYYYMALVGSSLTGTFLCSNNQTYETYALQAWGCAQMASAGPPLASGATLVSCTSFNEIFPMFGFSNKASALV
jgi:hypothetical protein